MTLKQITGEKLDIMQLNRTEYRKNLIKEIVPFIGLVFTFVFFFITTRGKLVEPSNLSSMIEACFTVTVVAVGATFVYAAGAFDISVGGVLGLTQVIIAYLMKMGSVPVPFLILGAILFSCICTGIIAVTTNRLRVPVFIVSLCMMNMTMGILILLVSKQDITIPYTKYAYFNTTSIKFIALMLVLGVGFILFNKTRIGRDLKAIGSNATAAEQSGVNILKATLIGFLLEGAFIAIASFFALVRVGQVGAQSGGGLGLDIMVAIVLGGFPLTGGPKSRMVAVIVGALTVTVLSSGLSLMGVDSSITGLVKGLLFLVIVAISYDKSKGKLIS